MNLSPARRVYCGPSVPMVIRSTSSIEQKPGQELRLQLEELAELEGRKVRPKAVAKAGAEG